MAVNTPAKADILEVTAILKAQGQDTGLHSMRCQLHRGLLISISNAACHSAVTGVRIETGPRAAEQLAHTLSCLVIQAMLVSMESSEPCVTLSLPTTCMGSQAAWKAIPIGLKPACQTVGGQYQQAAHQYRVIDSIDFLGGISTGPE